MERGSTSTAEAIVFEENPEISDITHKREIGPIKIWYDSLK